MTILNLTRKILPKLSAESNNNIEAIKKMPEIVLNAMSKSGDTSIVQVGMNQCAAARITPNGINTIFTDGLAGCNSVGIVAKGLDGKPIAILSHYTPLPKSLNLQVEAINKQLQTYGYFMDKQTKPTVFYNLRENFINENPIIPKVNGLLESFFKQGINKQITPYQNSNRPAFFSSANIFQFDKTNLNKLKITNVGEKEQFIDLKF